MQLLYIAAIAVLLFIIGYLLRERHDKKAFVTAKEDESLSLRNRISYLEIALEEERARGEGYKKLIKIKDAALEEAKNFFSGTPKGVINDKPAEAKVETRRPAPVVQKPQASRQEAVPSRPTRVETTPTIWPEPMHNHRYDDDSFSRDSGVCSAPTRSDSYDSSPSYSSSSDSGSSFSGGGCD